MAKSINNSESVFSNSFKMAGKVVKAKAKVVKTKAKVVKPKSKVVKAKAKVVKTKTKKVIKPVKGNKHEHGTLACYRKDACRCTPCKEANNLQWREYYAKHKAKVEAMA